MASESFISVRGEAVLEVEPELAVIGVHIAARDKDRHRALDLLAKRTQSASDLISAHSDAVEKVGSHPVRVRPEFKDGRPRERIAGYVASSGFTVTVHDFTVLSDLVTGLAGEETATLTGPTWQLRPASPVYRQAREVAAHDATQRAREYAQAFGGRLTGLVEAADTGLMTTDAASPRLLRRAAPMGAATGRAGAYAGDEPEFDFEPVKQTVHAQIEARFTMAPPELDS
jgi:uncharacterized protein